VNKILIVLVAVASLVTATLTTWGGAEAGAVGDRGYPVLGGDWRTGIVLGGFGYPYGYHGAYYGYRYSYRGPPCTRRDVWNGYGWVPAC
jgi:hypothetical protein